jgi:hypothetical protein
LSGALDLPDSRVVKLHHLPAHPLGVLAVAAALAVTACGSSGTSRNEYVKQLNKAEAALQKNLSGIGGAISDPKQAPAQLDAGGKAMEDAAADFEAITPPDDAKHAHGQFIDGLHKLADTFHGAAKQAKAKNLSGLQQTLTGLLSSPGISEIQDAQNELKAAGYKIEES